MKKQKLIFICNILSYLFIIFLILLFINAILLIWYNGMIAGIIFLIIYLIFLILLLCIEGCNIEIRHMKGD